LGPLFALMRTLATGTENLADPTTWSCLGPFPGLCVAVAIVGIAASIRTESPTTDRRVMSTTSFAVLAGVGSFQGLTAKRVYCGTGEPESAELARAFLGLEASLEASKPGDEG